jgi:hypothetical protein
MKKNLRYFMTLLLMMVASVGWGQNTVTFWEEDFFSFSADDVPSGGTYSYACTGTSKIYAEALAGGSTPELLVAKSGGSFSATVPLNGKSGEMNLQFKTNRNDLKVEVTGATLGEKVRSGNTDTYTLTGASGTLTIKFYMTINKNARLDDIKLYQGTALKPAGLSWGKASTSVTFGDEETYKNIPILSNENNLAVTCTSSDEKVATVSSAGVVTVAGAGKATITATFNGNDEYEAQTVSFELTVKEGGSVTPPTPSELTVAQALEIINGLEDGETTSETYTVKGFVVGTPDFQRKSDGTLYGNCNFDIADAKGGTPVLTIYRGKSFENNNFIEEDVAAPILIEGDEVVLTGGKLKKYVKEGVMTPELTNGYLVSVNVSVTITSCGYATLISNHALDFSKAGGATAYIVKDNDISDNAITLTQVTKVPANKGLVIAGTAGKTYSIPATSDETDNVAGNLMVGNANEDIPIEANQGYILAASDGLFHPCSGGKLAKGKAYLAVAVPTTGAKDLNIVFGEGTGINNVNVNENESGKIFNLAGQQMKSAVKGVYIKNGKKYVK